MPIEIATPSRAKIVRQTMINPRRLKIISLPDANIKLFYGVLGSRWASGAFSELQNNISWTERSIQLFGRKVKSPRLSAWHSDFRYTYSGLTWEPKTWTESLTAIKKKVEQISEDRFNGVLLNLYRHGQDSMGWHSDDEVELGPEPKIASLTLGAERRFLFRCRNNLAKKYTLSLPHDSLLIMSDKTQCHWQHSLPKTNKEIGMRINLTFRWVNY